MFDTWRTIFRNSFHYSVSWTTCKASFDMSSIEASCSRMTSDPETDFVHHIALFAALLCACIVIGHLLEESKWMNESITALAIGLGTGSVILLTSRGKSSHILEFKQEFFFIYLLPPIIFNAGFQVKKKHFFQNFTTITSFGAIGTLISFAIISFGATRLFPKLDIGYLDMKDYLALGAIFSATDSVCTLQVLNQEETPLLYSLVFGEGVVNDATSVVLFNAITKFDLSDMNTIIALKFAGNFLSLFVLSTLLGVSVGLLCSFTIRTLYFGRNSTDREVSLMILMAYLSYVLAEVFGLSGILTVFFCGIVMSHYAWHNVTMNSQVTTKHAFATMSFIAEIFIFMYVGMDALDVGKWRFVNDSPGKSFGASAVLLGLIMIGRACFVFPISIISNFIRKGRSDKIEFKQQVTVWWSGLMRGAVSVALAYKKFTGSEEGMQPANALLITSTIIVVLFSTMVFGLLTKPIVKLLMPRSSNVDHSQPSSPSTSIMMPLLEHNRHVLETEIRDDDESVPITTSLHILFNNPTNTIHRYWRNFDDAFMRPVFGGRGFISYVTGTRDSPSSISSRERKCKCVCVCEREREREGGSAINVYDLLLLLRKNKRICEMEGKKSKLTAHWWWLDSQSNSIPRKSPWLHSTLAELDDKTGAMLKLIEEDADSFAKRAEMYYKKRPELITIVEDLYRAHRSLAEKYDQVKFDSGTRHITPWTSCPLPLSKYRTSQLIKESEKSYDSYSESFDFDHDYDSAESEIDDPQHEEIEELKNSDDDVEEAMKLREEIDRLREVNKVQKEQLIQKDEEKREAIRQLSFSLDLLKQENVDLKRGILGKAKDSFKKQTNSNPFEFNKLKGVFWGKLFSSATVPL
ncbi:hypothetical protein L6452_43309 [Arctium lappa]|uniref:Uncharacterized protein n=1 Tax=Arctium lappa TaxID=4217 RepID=A0ACB8XKX2_ARCLA|nr:hypothetical protein L6452_43309 [Arctium lappa]